MCAFIDTLNLTKSYGHLVAVKSLSFEVAQKEIFGLLGPNGAGKTTTIGMLSTVIAPTGGTARVCGYDINIERDRVREKILLVSQEPALDMFLSVYDNLYFYSWLQGVPRKQCRELAMKVIDELELTEKMRVPVVNLSGGLIRRVQVSRAFLVERDVVLLDEPTLGLDPLSKLKVWKLIKEKVRRENTTVVVATNDMHEAEFLCDRIAFINGGELLALDTPEKLKESSGSTIVEVKTKKSVTKDLVLTMDNVYECRSDGKDLTLRVKSGASLTDLLMSLYKSGVEIEDLEVHKPSLQDLFVRLKDNKSKLGTC